MTDGPFPATRRGFVALAGTAVLTGCSGLNPLSADDPTTIDGAALREAVSGDAPTVPESDPVGVERAYVDRTAANVRETLSSVPAPFDASEVPNGMIRTELSEMHERATTALDDVSNARSPAGALGTLRRARETARGVAAGWRAVDGDFGFDDVRETASAVRGEVDDFRGRWRYVGDDSVRAVLAQATVEDRVAYAGRRLLSTSERAREVPANPVTVGEFAGDVEAARASLDDGAYLFDWFVSSLDDARPVAAGLRDAGESLTATTSERRDALPDADAEPSSYVDANVEGTAVGHALAELRDDVRYADRVDDERATGQRANVVLSAFSTLVRIRAFERLRERVAATDYVVVESAEDVRTMREAAVRAVEWALASGERPRLDRYVLRTAAGFDYVDERLGRYADDGDVAVERLNRHLARYLVIEAVARGTPETSADVAAVVESTV